MLCNRNINNNKGKRDDLGRHVVSRGMQTKGQMQENGKHMRWRKRRRQTRRGYRWKKERRVRQRGKAGERSQKRGQRLCHRQLTALKRESAQRSSLAVLPSLCSACGHTEASVSGRIVVWLVCASVSGCPVGALCKGPAFCGLASWTDVLRASAIHCRGSIVGHANHSKSSCTTERGQQQRWRRHQRL